MWESVNLIFCDDSIAFADYVFRNAVKFVWIELHYIFILNVK